jgi:cytochrome b pre-mRNA-processing protein 3
MDQTLREMGIGDMGIPKHMRKMMKGFNGRMHAYEEALTQGRLAGALRKNLYGTLERPDEEKLAKMEANALEMLEVLRAQSAGDILGGVVRFEEKG